ncbi:replicative DNA helicase [Spirochaeta africana]|uniref:Replicative DNA helicase n=1 Tax=Spirochaeta africana (strain ATCC 700263 / DSM 8902 / Z-7692) TaxID=889378 RepID=H9UKK1_SPIAZ|nr:replicative DNA helicase [Spirochaeta africana]AFG38044.1 replicative DNA helicase [Spirochaeta africana DSM 8902]
MSSNDGDSRSANGRVPPHNLEAEIACLGAILLNPREAVDRVVQKVRPADFYRPAHTKICEAALSLFNRNEVVDLITLTEELRGRGELEMVGGPGYLAMLTDSVPSSANVDYYAEIIYQESMRRKLITMGSAISEVARDHGRKTREIIEEFEKQLFEIAENRQTQEFELAGDIVKVAIDEIERRYRSENPFTGIPSGFTDLDNMLSGFQPSEFIIIGARPSIGKTSLALSLANRMAMQEKRRVGFFTLEMSKGSIMQRIIAMEARIDASRIRKGALRPADFHGLFDAADRIFNAQMWITDVPNMPLLDVRAQARRMKKLHDVEVIFIDYLTLISPEKKDIPRHEQIAEISRSLKALARELEIPVIVLSQVSRDSEGKRPSLANIRESGSIEQDADVVIFLHRERDATADETAQPVIQTELIVAKQRNGPVGTVPIAFVPKYAKFEEWSSADY